MSAIAAVPGRDDAWRVGDTEFVRSFGLDSTPERFCIRKHAPLMALYQGLCSQVVGGRIVELGIADGGGTALLALAAQPAKLVACELDPEPRPALDEFITHHQLSDVVRPFYGVDQADRQQLSSIVDVEFGDEAIDLVIDDASHLYEPTVASFEVLFPRLHPGGLFVVEDWAADYFYAQAIARAVRNPDDEDSATLAKRVGGAKHRQEAGESRPQPLPRLALQLLLAAAACPGTIAEVTFDRHWLSVRRGSDDLDARSFSLDDLYKDHFGWLEP